MTLLVAAFAATVSVLSPAPASAPLIRPGSASQELSTDVRRLEPSQMEEDLFVLGEALVQEHGGRLRYASEEELDDAFGEALFALEGARTVVEFHRTIAELLARIRCGHTHARLAQRDRSAALASRGVLPFQVRLVGERAWVRHVVGEGVPLEVGQEIAAIDGLGIGEIRTRALARLSGDGFIETGRERELEREFAELYTLLVDPSFASTAPYEIELVDADTPVSVAGIDPGSFAREKVRPERPPLMRLTFPAAGVARLAIRSFGDDADEDATFPELLERHFGTLRDRGIEHLLIDLRGNGGGNDMYGALLVSYIAPRPFGYFERIEVTADYQGEGGVVERDGMRLVTAHPGLQRQEPAALAFLAGTTILIDGNTFSTAADVATVAHHNGFASFAGEETGGGYDGNTSGMTQRVGLPNSGITVSVPQWMYTTANLGHAHAGRGVRPELEVQASIDDVLAGADPVLDAVLVRLVGGGASPRLEGDDR